MTAKPAEAKVTFAGAKLLPSTCDMKRAVLVAGPVPEHGEGGNGVSGCPGSQGSKRGLWDDHGKEK